MFSRYHRCSQNKGWVLHSPHFFWKRFARFVAGRSEDKLHKIAEKSGKKGSATSVVADATIELEVARLFNKVRLDGYYIDIAAYNVDSNIPSPLLETNTETLSRLATKLSGRIFIGKEAINAMNERSKDPVFTGATASLRAKPPFTAFAAAKAV